MGKATYTVLITDPSGATILAALGAGDADDGAPGITSLQVGPRANQVGSGSFTLTATPDVLAAVSAPDNRAVVLCDREGLPTLTRMAGPIESKPYTYTADRDGADGPGTVTVNFADDTAMLADMLIYPDPAHASTAQTTARYVISAVNPEDAARTLVNVQCGPGAIAARQLPGLVLGTDHGLLPGVTISTSFTRAQSVTDGLREICRQASTLGLGYRIVWTSARTLAFDVYQPVDRSASVWFSRDLGNIIDVLYEPTAPTGTVAIVGDETAGTGRIIHERVNTAAHTAGWRRREVFVDGRSAANSGELDQLGDQAVADGRPHTKVTARVRETDNLRYQIDFNDLDLVSFEVAAGVFVTEQIQGADITWSPDKGEQVSPLIGADSLELTDAKAKQIRDLQRQMALLHGAL